jgi:hypothetical protein
MAGAQIPLGILGDTEDSDTESLTKIVRGVIDDRFFEALESATSTSMDGADFTYELALFGAAAEPPPETGTAKSDVSESTGDSYESTETEDAFDSSDTDRSES